ncbi:hypothetical protein [Streptomyces syringium]
MRTVRVLSPGTASMAKPADDGPAPVATRKPMNTKENACDGS